MFSDPPLWSGNLFVGYLILLFSAVLRGVVRAEDGVCTYRGTKPGDGFRLLSSPPILLPIKYGLV